MKMCSIIFSNAWIVGWNSHSSIPSQLEKRVAKMSHRFGCIIFTTWNIKSNNGSSLHFKANYNFQPARLAAQAFNIGIQNQVIINVQVYCDLCNIFRVLLMKKSYCNRMNALWIYLNMPEESNSESLMHILPAIFNFIPLLLHLCLPFISTELNLIINSVAVNCYPRDVFTRFAIQIHRKIIAFLRCKLCDYNIQWIALAGKQNCLLYLHLNILSHQHCVFRCKIHGLCESEFS